MSEVRTPGAHRGKERAPVDPMFLSHLAFLSLQSFSIVGTFMFKSPLLPGMMRTLFLVHYVVLCTYRRAHTSSFAQSGSQKEWNTRFFGLKCQSPRSVMRTHFPGVFGFLYIQKSADLVAMGKNGTQEDLTARPEDRLRCK